MKQIVFKIENGIGVLICLLTILGGCVLQKPLSTQDIVGHYSVPTKFHPITLTLSQDGTYEYKHTYQMGSTIDYMWSNGTWAIQESNALILRSRIQPQDATINTHQLTIAGDSDVDSTKIQLLNDNGEPIPFVNVRLIKDGAPVTGNVTKISGRCSLPTVKADSVYISQPGYKKIKIPYEKVEGKKCVFEMANFPADYRFFTDQKFEFKGNKILFMNFWPIFGDSKNIRKRFFKKENRVTHLNHKS